MYDYCDGLSKTQGHKRHISKWSALLIRCTESHYKEGSLVLAREPGDGNGSRLQSVGITETVVCRGFHKNKSNMN